MRDRLSVLWSFAGAAALAVMLGVAVPQPNVVVRCADPSWWCTVLWWCNC